MTDAQTTIVLVLDTEEERWKALEEVIHQQDCVLVVIDGPDRVPELIDRSVLVVVGNGCLELPGLSAMLKENLQDRKIPLLIVAEDRDRLDDLLDQCDGLIVDCLCHFNETPRIKRKIDLFLEWHKLHQELRDLQEAYDCYAEELQHKEHVLRDEMDRRVKAERDLENMVGKDYMTGLSNRRVMYEKLNEEMSRFRRTLRSFCCIKIDIDDFQHICDNVGFDAGDSVITALARILSSSTRNYDLVCRWGHKEFLVLLMEADINIGADVAESLRSQIEDMVIDYYGNEIKVTASLGVAVSEPDISITELIKRVDESLYRSKMAGKNQISCYG